MIARVFPVMRERFLSKEIFLTMLLLSRLTLRADFIYNFFGSLRFMHGQRLENLDLMKHLVKLGTHIKAM